MKNVSGHVMCKGIWQVIFNQKEYLYGFWILNFIFEAVDNISKKYLILEYLNVRKRNEIIIQKQHLEVRQDIQ